MGLSAKELRIGNYVRFRTGEIEQVSQIFILNLNKDSTLEKINDYDVSDYSPIPLSEEILLKAGFKVGYPGCRFNGWEVEFAYGKYLGKHLEADKLYLAVNSAEYHISDIPIEYLHQLQNIIFDLTKKEIEFKI